VSLGPQIPQLSVETGCSQKSIDTYLTYVYDRISNTMKEKALLMMSHDALTVDLELVTHAVFPGGYAAAVVVNKGDLLEVVDMEGQQVCDLIAFASIDRREWLSISHTRATTLRLNLALGDILQSNWRRPMLEVLADDVGMHDLITQMCDERRYQFDYNVEGHRSCRTNFTEVLAPWGIQEWEMPDPVNLFQNAPIAALATNLPRAWPVTPSSFAQ
jgi:uncharacterized protein YcgI (DUF1989 family)